MIGVFDSGHGGLTVFAELVRRFPRHSFVYLGDHAHAPYGDRPGPEIVDLTRVAVDRLFEAGCALVLLGCNTATAVAARTLQQEWMPSRPGKRLLGIIAPTVEAVTQTPWMVKEPVFPQKYNTDTVALFATRVTVESGVFAAEIAKRCPHMRLESQACPDLVPLIERGAAENELKAAVRAHVQALLAREPHPHWAILGCTHYPLVERYFKEFLPPFTRVMSQPVAVADALDDYLSRHPDVVGRDGLPPRYFTTGDVDEVRRVARTMLGVEVPFERMPNARD